MTSQAYPRGYVERYLRISRGISDVNYLLCHWSAKSFLIGGNVHKFSIKDAIFQCFLQIVSGLASEKIDFDQEGV